MNRLFRLPHFSPFWFWLGVAAGSLFWYLLTRWLPTFRAWQRRAAEHLSRRRESRWTHATRQWRRWLYGHLQKQHLAAPLFPLEAVLVPPRVVAPPPAYLPRGVPRPDDIATLAIPPAPHTPELAAFYRYPALSLPEALAQGADLLLWGPYGAGKSTALAYLALLATRQDPALGDLSTALPLLVHAADLLLPLPEDQTPLQGLLLALRHRAPTRLLKNLRRALAQNRPQGTVLLLLDGLDELPPQRQPAVAAFLEQLRAAHPRLRLVVAAAPEYSDGLQSLGLRPVNLLPWDRGQAAAFLRRWQKAWQQFVAPHEEKDAAPEAALLNAWLRGLQPVHWPFHLALNAWAAYAGDALGPHLPQSIHAWLRRSAAGEGAPATVGRAAPPPDEAQAADRASFPQHLSDAHPLVRAYLQAQGLDEDARAGLGRGALWAEPVAVLGFLAAEGQGGEIAQAWLDRDDAPLHRHLLAVGRALGFAPGQASWRGKVWRTLTDVMTAPTTPPALRVQAAATLALSGEKGLGPLFARFFPHSDPTVRQAAALAAGLVGSPSAREGLEPLLHDADAVVRRAAALALAAIGSEEALKALAALLLQGDDDQKRVAAEALANHPEEGHPTLQEAMVLEGDYQVRKAAVYGLRRLLPTAWAREALQKAQIEDSQWVVRDVATAALENFAAPSPFVPRPLRPLHEAPWLVAFAASKGLGVAPGQAALRLLHQVLREGSPEQQEAALGRVPYFPQETWTPEIQPLLASPEPPLSNAAYFAQWQLAVAGAG